MHLVEAAVLQPRHPGAGVLDELSQLVPRVAAVSHPAQWLAASQRSASSAAMQPVPAAVTAWR